MKFTTNSYPREQRKDEWSFALKRRSIEVVEADDELYGELVTYKSGQGILFARIVATKQKFIVDLDQDSSSFWMALILDGQASIDDGKTKKKAGAGSIVFGGGEAVTRFEFEGDHRLLLVRTPNDLPSLRNRARLPSEYGLLDASVGIARMLAGMLGSVSDGINELDDDQLRPIELALPEFITAALLDHASEKDRGGATGARASILDRVFQTIEMRLSDPDLNLQAVAAEHGISPRYLQKLFESYGESFSQYVKLQRLERCRLDLGSPLHAQRSISEILFHWGFNDSASFSRAFRDRYGVSPRQYRKSPRKPSDGEAISRRGRPGSVTTTDKPAPDNADLHPDDFEHELEHSDTLPQIGAVRHHFLPATRDTIHWGYFSSSIKPVLKVESRDYITVETLTHHANDDPERMVEGDPGAESIYRWTKDGMAVERRGAGPMDGSAVGRGPGEGFGVHICTGPIEIEGAQPGDIVQVRILSLTPRPSGNPRFAGRTFGSNAATFWGFQYHDLLTEPKPREVITIYEVEQNSGRSTAHAVYNYRWTPQTDPSGNVHERYDYPGVPVDPETIERNFDVLRDIEIPVRPHFGVIGLAPPHPGIVDSIPPSNYGGNIDNWRLGANSSLFLPVGVEGGLLSLGDPHASQGDAEVCGTAIECSMTATIQVILHPASRRSTLLRDLDYPLIETDEDYVVIGFSHPDYLRELGGDAQSAVYEKSSLDLAMRDAFRKARRFLMSVRNLSEDEAISLLSVAADFGVTQVANGNWGVHVTIKKSLFTH